MLKKRKSLIGILMIVVVVLMLASLCAYGCSSKTKSETMVYKNGNIYTSNANQDYVTAIVVKDGEFIYAGDDAGAAEYEEGLPAENIVDLGGKLVTAGLIEGHAHPESIAVLNTLHFCEIPANITLEQSLEELKKIVAEHPDYEQYVVGNFGQTLDLTAKQLDTVCADKAIICFGAGFHCGYVNSKFMEQAGINKDSTDAIPEKSYYERDAQGNPTGKIIELPQTWMAFRQAFTIDKAALKEALISIFDTYHSMGFIGSASGATCAADEDYMLDVLSELESENKLNMIYCPATVWLGHTVTDIDEVKERALSQKKKYTSDLLHPGTVKMWVDGATGAGSALLSQPYSTGTANNYGIELTTLEDLIACAQMCKDNDLNCHFHAIGDKAIENALTAYETVGESTAIQSIAHFSVSTPELIEKASNIKNLIVNFTPVWANSIAKEEVDCLGERRNNYCLFKETMDAGVTVNFGADSNGSPDAWDPVLTTLVAMFRDPDEEGLLLKGNACTFEEAMDAYSINVAKERRIDDEHGSIEVGKSADFVIWNVEELTEDIYNQSITTSGEITDDRPLALQDYLNGKLVYQRESK